MGGTFDPIHNGHLLLGRQALLEQMVDVVWYMPAKAPPHKKGKDITDAGHRLAMVRLATGDDAGFRCSDFELARDGFSYTVDTLRLLGEAYPCESFSLIIGADSFLEIETWYESAGIMELAPLLVAGRSYARCKDPETALETQKSLLEEKYHARIHFLRNPHIDISSTAIREMIQEGQDPSAFVPESVLAYIHEHGLYHAHGQRITGNAAV
jgi:nicotinate-nucleotide adenylyltransferase